MENKNFYQGLYGNNSIELTRGFVNIHPFGIIGKNFNNFIDVHVHNDLFQIFYITEGTTELHYNGKTTLVQGPIIITIPKNIPHGFKHQSQLKGWIFSLSDSVLESLLNREAEVLFTLYNIYAKKLNIETIIDKKISKLIEDCVFEYYNTLPGKLLMLQNLTGQLIIELFRLQNHENLLEKIVDNSHKVHFKNFMLLISKSRSFKKTLDEYAQELNITTTHLTRITKNISNKSPREIILDYYITEAKVLLSNLKYNINEVASELDIDDPSYFSRLFKKKTNLTPKEFQKEIKVKS